MGTACTSVTDRLKHAPRMELANEIAWWKFKREAVNEVAEYAERWARLMQLYMANGERLEDVAEATLLDVQEELIEKFLEKKAEYVGIDYLNTCALLSLTQYWKYGERLQSWHKREGYKYFNWMRTVTSSGDFEKPVFVLVSIEKLTE